MSRRFCYHDYGQPWRWWEGDGESINFDALALPDKAKSRREKMPGGGESWEALRVHCKVTVRLFARKIQRHMIIDFCARDWPIRPYHQHGFAERLILDMAFRVFGDGDWYAGIAPQADCIVRAVNQVLGGKESSAPGQKKLKGS